MPTPYEAQFPIGTQVRIASRPILECFSKEWKYHDPLSPAQLGFAGMVAVVKHVAFYHGGDPLYQLEEVPGAWHEECLEPT